MPTPCPGCSKFAALEVGETEVEEIEINEDHTITAQVHFTLTSECCNEEMKETTVEFSHEVGAVLLESLLKEGVNALECELDIDSSSASADEVRVKGKKGYEVELAFTLTSDAFADGKKLESSVKETVLLSEMDDMV